MNKEREEEHEEQVIAQVISTTTDTLDLTVGASPTGELELCVKMAYRYYRCFTGTTADHRYCRWKFGTTGSSISRQISASKLSREKDLPVPTDVHRYYRWFTSTTGETSVLPIVQFYAQFSARSSRPVLPVGNRYYRCILVKKKLCKCPWVQCVSQAFLTDWHEHSYQHLASLVSIPLDSTAIPITQVKKKSI